MPVTKCQCPIAGYCKTHHRTMSAARHRQCQTEPGYFEAFAQAREQADSFIGPPIPPKKPRGCGCQKRKEKMNAIIPKSGDAVEWFTTKTGIKNLVESRQGYKD